MRERAGRVKEAEDADGREEDEEERGKGEAGIEMREKWREKTMRREETEALSPLPHDPFSLTPLSLTLPSLPPLCRPSLTTLSLSHSPLSLHYVAPP